MTRKTSSRFSDSYRFWRVAEGVPKTTMKAWKSYLSEEQIWQVIAFMHQFSHGGKPSNTPITSPELVRSIRIAGSIYSLLDPERSNRILKTSAAGNRPLAIRT